MCWEFLAASSWTRKKGFRVDGRFRNPTKRSLVINYKWNPMKHSDILNINWLSGFLHHQQYVMSLFLWVHFVYLSDGIPAISCRDFVIWRNNYRTGHCCRWIWTNQRIQGSDGMWRFPRFFHIFPGPFWCLYTAPKGAYEMMVISTIFYWCLPDQILARAVLNKPILSK